MRSGGDVPPTLVTPVSGPANGLATQGLYFLCEARLEIEIAKSVFEKEVTEARLIESLGGYSEKQSTLSQLAANPLFSPATHAMRADPRFLPLVEKQGLMEYWRTTKSQPDVCETEAAPFCAALKVAAKP